MRKGMAHHTGQRFVKTLRERLLGPEIPDHGVHVAAGLHTFNPWPPSTGVRPLFPLLGVSFGRTSKPYLLPPSFE